MHAVSLKSLQLILTQKKKKTYLLTLVFAICGAYGKLLQRSLKTTKGKSYQELKTFVRLEIRFSC